MKKLFILLVILILLGCEQLPDDPDNAIVSGYIYHQAVPIESVLVDGEWKYVNWEFYDPAESVQVFVESDINSSTPYRGPDVIGYTDSTGFYSIPVYLGHTEIKDYKGNIVGYDYVDYCDVRVLIVQDGRSSYDFGGGITLNRGGEFRLWTIAMTWFISP